EDAVDFKKCEKMLTEAKSCQDRMEKDMYKLKPRIETAKDMEMLAQLKKLLTSVVAQKKDVDYVLTWQELPGDDGVKLTHASFKAWMHHLATQTEQNQEGIESLKAVLKARKL
ncbi:unnamed protein product, partial [Durusdinium trenchii]